MTTQREIFVGDIGCNNLSPKSVHLIVLRRAIISETPIGYSGGGGAAPLITFVCPTQV